MLMVADISTSFRSLRSFSRHFSTPSRKSVKMCRSCTSSITITLYWDSSWSVDIWRRSRPSVRNRILVEAVFVFSKRTWKATWEPYSLRVSWPTRFAREMHAMRRGWVQAIFSNPASIRYCGIWNQSRTFFYRWTARNHSTFVFPTQWKRKRITVLSWKNKQHTVNWNTITNAKNTKKPYIIIFKYNQKFSSPVTTSDICHSISLLK